jgi:putative FmdB family regulatory protein
MPTYDYECQSCEHVFEVFQNITASPLEECPKCKGKVKRLIGAGGGIIFKGSGFYVTDYKKDSTSGAKKKKNSSVNTSSSNSKAPNKSNGSQSSSNTNTSSVNSKTKK